MISQNLSINLFLLLLLVISVIDYRIKKIPKWSLVLIIILKFITEDSNIIKAIISALLILICLICMLILINKFNKDCNNIFDCVGGGDIKLITIFVFYMGIDSLDYIAFSLLLAMLYFPIYKAIRKYSIKLIAYAPFLLTSTLIILFLKGGV